MAPPRRSPLLLLALCMALVNAVPPPETPAPPKAPGTDVPATPSRPTDNGGAYAPDMSPVPSLSLPLPPMVPPHLLLLPGEQRPQHAPQISHWLP